MPQKFVNTCKKLKFYSPSNKKNNKNYSSESKPSFFKTFCHRYASFRIWNMTVTVCGVRWRQAVWFRTEGMATRGKKRDPKWCAEWWMQEMHIYRDEAYSFFCINIFVFMFVLRKTWCLILLWLKLSSS